MNPLSRIFGAGVAVRNSLYDSGLFASHKLQKPVVSVGNLSVGGSGKTPFVIALGTLLRQRGISFDVLSRGYGRDSRTVTTVDPKGSACDFGDEPVLMARKLNAPIIVGADRYQAGLLAEKSHAAQLHLLDDGFQHRRLHRDIDIVMLPESDLRGTLLPTGRLREPQSSLRRADVLVASPGVEIPQLFSDKQIWRIARTLDLEAPLGRALAFCGIAKPDQFLAQLGSLDLELVATHTFADHHRYTPADVQLLLEKKTQNKADFFIATEKDAINLGVLASKLGPLNVARLTTTLKDPNMAMQWLISTLEQRCGCRL